MKGLTFRTASTLFTFIVGIGVATAWGFHSRQAVVPPVAIDVTETGATHRRWRWSSSSTPPAQWVV